VRTGRRVDAVLEHVQDRDDVLLGARGEQPEQLVVVLQGPDLPGEQG
jgi:hypothetical protein